MHATPEGKGFKPRKDKYPKGRLPLPGVGGYRYMLEAFTLLGSCQIVGMGTPAPLPYSEVVAYATVCPGHTQQELLCLRLMSVAYTEGLALTDPFSPAPWRPDVS